METAAAAMPVLPPRAPRRSSSTQRALLEDSVEASGHKTYLEQAREFLESDNVAENARRRLTRKGTWERRKAKVLASATDTTLRALMDAAAKSSHKYVYSDAETISHSSSQHRISDACHEAVSTAARQSHPNEDGSQDHLETGGSVQGAIHHMSQGKLVIPVLSFPEQSVAKRKNKGGYCVSKQKRSHSAPRAPTSLHGLEVDRVVAVEPNSPCCNVRISRREYGNWIVPTDAPVPSGVKSITVNAADFKKYGNDLSKLRKYELEHALHGAFIDVRITKSPGEKLGLTIDPDSLKVISVHSGGCLAEWNARNSESAVRIGCRLVEVNGKRDVLSLLDGLRKASCEDIVNLKFESSEAEAFECSVDAVTSKEVEEDAEPYDPWAGMPVLEPVTSNDSGINQVWFPPPRESCYASERDVDSRASTRVPSLSPPTSERRHHGDASLHVPRAAASKHLLPPKPRQTGLLVPPYSSSGSRPSSAHSCRTSYRSSLVPEQRSGSVSRTRSTPRKWR